MLSLAEEVSEGVADILDRTLKQYKLPMAASNRGSV